MVRIIDGKLIYDLSDYDDVSIFNFFILLAIIQDYDILDVVLSKNPDFIFDRYLWFFKKMKEWADRLGSLEFYRIYDYNNSLVYLVKSEGSIKIGHYAGSVNEHMLVTAIQMDNSVRSALFPLVYVRLALAVLHRNKELFKKYAEIVKNNILQKSREELHFSDFYGDHIIRLVYPVSFCHMTGAFFGVTFNTKELLDIQERLRDVALGKIEPIATFRKEDIPLVFYAALKLYREEYMKWISDDDFQNQQY